MLPAFTHLADLLRWSAARVRDRVALQDDTGRRCLTYRDLWIRVARDAEWLRRHGLSPGDRVLLVMESGPDWMPMFLALMDADVVAVPLPSGTPAALVAVAARHAGARVCVHDRPHAGVAEGIGARCMLADAVGADTPAGTVPLSDPFAAASRARHADATAVLAFTSGSTSQPRAVSLSHRSLIANLTSLFRVRGAAPDETLLSLLPPSHAYELVAGQLAPLTAGARLVYASSPMPNRIVDALRTQGVTRALVVPALLDAVVRHVIDRLATEGVADRACARAHPGAIATAIGALNPRQRDRIRSAVRAHVGESLRALAAGGAASDPAWRDVLATFDVALDVGYGLTEAGPLVSVGSSEAPRGSVGRPLPGVEVRVDARGEILVRGEAVMQGYAGDPHGSREAVVDGWLRTGDRGWIDEAGFLFVTGRIKEAIVPASGETLYPDEVEPYYASPLFAEHCVVPAPAAHGNDEPLLVVVPADLATPHAALERAFAALRAAAPARYRVTRMVRRADPLPRTALGKVKRRQLAEATRLREVTQ